MSDAKKFKFVSPGIFIKEIDKSLLDVEPDAIGPLVVGRSQKGPAGTPIKVRSYAEFVEIFGEPLPGIQSGDVFRDGNKLAPTYASYAAKAWLTNNSPLTFVRLLGEQHTSAGATGLAGWGASEASTSGIAQLIRNAADNTGGPSVTGGGAYALWLFNGEDQITTQGITKGLYSKATITFTGKPTEAKIITLTDADGTALTFEVDDDDDGAAGDNIALVPGGSTAAAIASELAAEVNGESSLAITATNPTTTTVLLTMDTVGTTGDTTITSDFNNATVPATFTGGANNADTADGVLAAVFYCDADTTIVLSGTFDFDKTTTAQTTASQAATIGTSSAGTLSVLIGTPNTVTGDDGQARAEPTKIDFNFTRGSDSFIRKVFNTDPTLTNADITTTDSKGYFLGETYEGWVEDKLKQGNYTGWGAVTHGLIMGLRSRDASIDGADFRFGRKNAHTGWYISQDTGAPENYNNEATQKLFRFISLDQGEWTQNNIKISIEDIALPTDKYNKYGTFSVVIRHLRDRDAAPQLIETYRGVNLNPSSPDYIKRRIGDKYYQWNTTEERYREYGEYNNVSKYIRVDMNESVDNGAVGEGLVPFGVYGPYRFKNAQTVTGACGTGTDGLGDYGGDVADANLTAYHMIVGDNKVAHPVATTCLFTSSMNSETVAGTRLSTTAGASNMAITSSFQFPELALRNNAMEGDIDDARKAYWGVRTERSGSRVFDDSVLDVVRALPGASDFERDGGSNYTELSWIFSLDNVVQDSGSIASYISGSRKTTRTSYTANNSAKKLVNEKKWNRFTTLLHGGFDGFDITEKDPLRNEKLDDATELTNYTYNTVKQAVQSIRDPELLEYNIASIPGMTNATLTKLLVDQCETRGDALAIIDLENNGTGTGMYQPNSENNETEKTRVDNQNIDTVRTKLEDREINSSYGCTYYPWIQIRDDNTAAILKVPPSVVALGAMSFSEAQQAPWFAPAGFTRGGLSNGAAGLNVVGVTHKLTSEDRDKLYEANINPIATFPSEGIVVFGQKTLQVTPSALDRINVRRLLILLKKEVSSIAATTLFEQNQQATWLSFSSRVKRFLTGVKSQLGLTDFKVVLDETTTTPDLIDRNVMYAKIYLKPARSIEFIALDFIITDSGASFED